MRTLLPIFFALLVAGCGSKGAYDNPTLRLNSLAAQRDSQPFQGVTIAELAGWDRPANTGKRIALRAKVERVTYALGYGETYHGYQLVDGQGHALLIRNCYTKVTSGTKDTRQELTREGQRRLLLADEPLSVEGVYHPSHTASSHNGIYTVPAGLELWRVDGAPVDELRER